MDHRHIRHDSHTEPFCHHSRKGAILLHFKSGFRYDPLFFKKFTHHKIQPTGRGKSHLGILAQFLYGHCIFSGKSMIFRYNSHQFFFRYRYKTDLFFPFRTGAEDHVKLFFFQAPDQVPGSCILEMKINLLPFLLIKKPTYKFRNKSASLGMDISDGNASAWNPCRLLDPLHTKIQDM